jgi:hypothetical protein
MNEIVPVGALFLTLTFDCGIESWFLEFLNLIIGSYKDGYFTIVNVI